MGTGIGSFSGGYTLRRVNVGEYLYRPDPIPLAFTRPNGQQIVVDEMLGTTDLGSTPRIIWWIPGLSPNDIERPAIVHDFLYLRHHAGLPTPTFQECNRILAEACIAEGYSRSMAWLIRVMADAFGREWWDHDLAEKWHITGKPGRPWIVADTPMGKAADCKCKAAV